MGIITVIGILGVCWLFGDWTIRYRTRLDSFFGKGNWEVVSEDAEMERWKISNHAYKINQGRYKIYSSKRYRASQALTLELMEISFNVVNSLEYIEKRLLEKYGENASLLH